MPLKYGVPFTQVSSCLLVLFQRITVYPRFYYCSFYYWGFLLLLRFEIKSCGHLLIGNHCFLFCCCSESYFLWRGWNIMEMMTKNICFKIYCAAFLAMDLKINCLLSKKCRACSSFTTKSGNGVRYSLLGLKRKSAERLGKRHLMESQGRSPAAHLA